MLILGDLLFLALLARRRQQRRRGIMLQLLLTLMVLLSGSIDEFRSFCTGVCPGASSSFR
jgi:hypothetical protein